MEHVRTFSKRTVNPVVMRFAGSAHSSFAVVRHVGRRSGRAYATPLLLVPVADGFVIELTYGFAVDWYRNVVAAGHCTILWHGREYECDAFEVSEADMGLQAFPAILRLPLRMLGARDFVKMKVLPEH
ncbi:peptidase [Dictyobacter sp. S3.2.2.5]|uniref:Peptidase n=2 Tax=Dictyobacter halimunensis TaxID=3026934 RepID=A0ABQ6G2A9_9CHLR|nr:peptidase [Dictyobacter sp. S3.2.2.5]